jgi:UDP-N-acetylmuramate--alanine ligase
MGVAAQGLAGVAESLARRGMMVSGSLDGSCGSPLRLAPRGVKLRETATGRLLTNRTRLLVHGPEVERQHPIRLGALRRGVRQQTPAEWLAEQLAGRRGVVFAGGGESTAAATMTAWILAESGADPSALLTRPARQLGGWARVGRGAPFVVDWPEPAENLAAARPEIALLMGLGRSMVLDPQGWCQAMRVVTESMDGIGSVLAQGHPALASFGPLLSGVEWVSLRQGADWWATDLREESGRFRFRIFHRGRYVIEVRLAAPGLRHVVAALAAVAACVRLGASCEAIRHGLESFGGIARDFEPRGSYRGVTLVDDDSTDPGSVHDVLSLARRAYGNRRLCVAFGHEEDEPWDADASPETAVRRAVAAFALADRVLVVEENPTSRHGPAGSRPLLADVLNQAGVPARRAVGLAGALSELDRRLEPGDVLLTLGAGDVGLIADAFIRRLSCDRPGG